MLAKQPVSTVTQDRGRGRRRRGGGDQSVTRSEGSIIQKNHDADRAAQTLDRLIFRTGGGAARVVPH